MSKRSVTIQNVADAAGVSKATVSHVINNTRPVSEEIRRRVLDVMSDLHYKPNTLARSLRRQESLMIGLIVPRIDNPYYAEVTSGVEELSFELGYNVILCNSDRNIEKEVHYTELLVQKRVDGILFVGAWIGDRTKHLYAAYEQGIPIVVIDRITKDINIPSVVTDNFLGGSIATSHLFELGHRRIGCLGGTPKYTPNAARIEGYLSTLRDVGIPVRDELITKADFNFEGGYYAMKTLLNQKDPPSAVFACNDLMAIGAMRCAFDRGYNVPQDISIIGFDDIQMAPYVNPPLTTIAQKKVEMGKRGAELLVERIQKADLPIRQEVIQPKLIVRSSTSSQLSEPSRDFKTRMLT